jgi:hypothetical protein
LERWEKSSLAVSQNRETQSAIDRAVNVECVSGRDVAGAEHSSEYNFFIAVKAWLAEEVPSKSDRSDACSIDCLGLGQKDSREGILECTRAYREVGRPEGIRQHQTKEGEPPR